MQLREYIEKNNIIKYHMARALKCDISHFFRIVAGEKHAGKKLALKIQKYTDGQVLADSLMWHPEDKLCCPMCGRRIAKNKKSLA